MKTRLISLSVLTLMTACGDASPHGPPADASMSDALDAAAEADAASRDASELPADRDADIDTSQPDSSLPEPDAGGVRLPPLNAELDYQLGEAYAPPSGVTVLSRDRRARPAAGLYNICYVNGFQAQPDEEDFWLDDQPDLVLRDGAGKPVIDADWDEMLLDVSSAAKRMRIASIVGGWIEDCAADGFDAVEIDNLDSYSRSGGRLQQDHAVAFMHLLSARAHQHGLAIAQKNSAEIVDRRSELGTDFVVAEECNRYTECDVYTEAYGDHVLVIEYRRQDFEKGCSAYPELSIVLRDVNLVAPGRGGYVFDGC
jgi:hypothetical protein